KLALLMVAVSIGVASMWYTNDLVTKLSQQEANNVKIWAKTLEQTGNNLSDLGDQTIALDVLQNSTIPRILTTENDEVISSANVDETRLRNDSVWRVQLLDQMRAEKDPIVIEIKIGEERFKNIIYYSDSIIIKQLRWYPYFQLGVISLFLLVSYLAFSSSRNAEQNQVWVGMAKETAHQLGTPLSSLMAWVDYLKSKDSTDTATHEIEKDIIRLNTISERFSKIGSAPVLKRENVGQVVDNSIKYFAPRTSSKVTFQLNQPTTHEILAPMNIPLFEWVLENLFKNAVDAMEGQGALTVTITDQSQFVYIDVADTGKGISKSKHQTVFKPGYTSKSRGWGLGLSLSKRIVEEYHGGKIFVKNSELKKGTTFRIVLSKKV
ncbi:MAG: sensor histidine kinase, partial [Bacteroidia bacterium]